MKISKLLLFSALLPLTVSNVTPQVVQLPEERIIASVTVDGSESWWNQSIELNTFRLPPPQKGATVTYIDLTGNGHADVLRTILPDGTPIQWIDDDGDMQIEDLWGDTDSDCLMIDRNRDGLFGSYGDLIVDWVDKDGDGIADIQIVVDNIPEKNKNISGGGHFMLVLDTDRDNVFNYIDWNTYELRCWLHSGMADFYTDYHGNSAFLKIHSTPERMNDVRLNWENPFLFFDSDSDGLTEMTIRLCDSRCKSIQHPNGKAKLSGEMDYAAISVDLDNDNNPENPLDFDMTINYQGDGSDYTQYSHICKAMRGLPEADGYFLDATWRRNTRLIFPDHNQAFDFIFRSATWTQVWFTFDEDDDCKRWERVELYQPLDLYKTGEKNGGLDDNRQADVTGDRGEWDTDNSGHGNLYVSPMDGKIHLYGAEWGAWRIDQRAEYYQNMGGIYDVYGPERQQGTPQKFPVIKYEDTNDNGFLDRMWFDFDGDGCFEEMVSLPELGIDDSAFVFEIDKFQYSDYATLFKEIAERMWKNATLAAESATMLGLNTTWYATLMSPKSLRQMYDYGYWLQLYLYHDIKDIALKRCNTELAEKAAKAYFSSDWNSMLNYLKTK